MTKDRAPDYEGDDPPSCAKCGVTLYIPVGYDPTEFCCGCAHDEIDRLRAQTTADQSIGRQEGT